MTGFVTDSVTEFPFLGMAMTKFVVDSVTESVFSLSLWRSMFLLKLPAFTLNGSDIVCAGVCFIKASGHYYK